METMTDMGGVLAEINEDLEAKLQRVEERMATVTNDRGTLLAQLCGLDREAEKLRLQRTALCRGLSTTVRERDGLPPRTREKPAPPEKRKPGQPRKVKPPEAEPVTADVTTGQTASQVTYPDGLVAVVCSKRCGWADDMAEDEILVAKCPDCGAFVAQVQA